MLLLGKSNGFWLDPQFLDPLIHILGFSPATEARYLQRQRPVPGVMVTAKKWQDQGDLIILSYGGFHKWGTPIAGWFIRENPIRVDDSGVPLFQETLI